MWLHLSKGAAPVQLYIVNSLHIMFLEGVKKLTLAVKVGGGGLKGSDH